MYGIPQDFNRLSEKEYKIRTVRGVEYTYVDHGFYNTINMFWPLPLGFLWICGHFLYIYGCYRVISQKLWLAWIVNFWYGTWGGLAATGGVHRLWCHRSYEADFALRYFLMLGQTMTGQTSIYSWSVGHRIHHKYTDSDGDPHNTKRGFLFAHIGWVFRREHPDVTRKEKLYDYSDLMADPVVKFQHENYWKIYGIICVIVPIALQLILCGSSLLDAFVIGYVMRNISIYHDTAFVNSAAHMFGDRPYNKTIEPRENYYVSLAAFGEGYHNYHHNFPQDYKAAEHAAGFNLTTVFIDLCALFGLAWNLRTASTEVVKAAKDKNASSIDEPIDCSTKKVVTWANEVIKNRRIGELSCEFL